MTARKPLTPEGASMKAIRDYLDVIRIGRVKRVNVGQVRMGEAPKHPWARDTRRVVRFGEVGASDLAIELNLDDPRIPAALCGRDLFPEVKRPGWNPPPHPKPGAATSTWAKYRHYLDQQAFVDRQNQRGNLAGFVRSPRDLYVLLFEAGFVGLPVPVEPRNTRTRGNRSTGVKTNSLEREIGSQHARR